MRRFLILAVFILGVSLRLFWLDKYPTGFTPDEASFGYDAYSILKTGRDQWGKTFPLVLESFGDFKSPLYSYLALPTVAIFGLNKFGVRLPNAILGSSAILVVYFLSKELFKSEKAGIISALLLAISPWHVQLSRGAFEANLTTFFLPLGTLLFLKKKYSFSALAFGLNLFTYHSAKIITPAVVILLAIFYQRQIREKTKDLWLGFIIFLFFLVLTVSTFLQGAGARVSERSIAAGALEEAFMERSHSSSLFHNKYTVIAGRFFRNYATYLSPQFFFTDGPKEGTYGMVPGQGVLFWFVIPFMLVVRKLYFQGKYKTPVLFLGFWILLSPIPAALATGVGYHANRAAVMMPAFEIALGLGAAEFLSWVKNKKMFLYAFYSFTLLLFIFFLEDYFVQSPYKVGKSMLYGNLEAAEWVSQNVGTNREITVGKSLSEPHIYFAFAQKTDPIFYQETTKSWNYKTWVDQLPEYSLGNYTFKDISKEDLLGKSVLVGRPEDFPEGTKSLHTIYYPDGKEAVLIIDPNQGSYAKTN